MAKKVLILYASIGLGHKSIAENIGFYLTQAGFQVELHDAQQVQGGFLAKWGKKFYGFLVNHAPFVWDWLYNTPWFISATLPYRTWVAGFNYKNILDVINQFKPDIIISTHVTPSAVINYLKTKNLYNGKFGIAFSDFHLHRYWLFNKADFYLANTEEQKQEMISLGISSAKIFVCGITLKLKTEVNIAQTKNKFNILPEQKVILIASGSQGTGVDENLIAKFLNQPQIKIIVACGKNKELFEALSKKFTGQNITILNYYSPMDALYAIADIYITKPGGLSVAEALQWQLPILVSHLLPGQEIHNYNYLLSKGLVMPKALDIEKAALEELNSGRFKEGLAGNPNLPAVLGNGESILKGLNSQA